MKKIFLALMIATMATSGILLSSCGGGNEPEPEAYKVTFVESTNVSVKVFNKQDYSTTPVAQSYAYSVDSTTGDYLKDGEGQVNFKIVTDDGYYCSLATSDVTYDATLTETPYSNLKYIGDGIYRITKITADLFVAVNAVSGNPAAYSVTFTIPEHVSLSIYASDDSEVAESGVIAYSRDDETGAYLQDGEGQVNFLIEVDDGYYCNLGNSAIAETTYKNFKACGDHYYRITKITGNLNVTIPVSSSEPEHYSVTFVPDAHSSVTSYVSEEAAQSDVGAANATSAYAREGTSGEIIVSGEGKSFFKVVVADGYTCSYLASAGNITITGSYKNLKEEADEDDATIVICGYITKIASDLTVTITCTANA